MFLRFLLVFFCFTVHGFKQTCNSRAHGRLTNSWPDVFHIFRRARWSGIFAINSIKKYLTPPSTNGIHINNLSDLPMRSSQGWYYIIWLMVGCLWFFSCENSKYRNIYVFHLCIFATIFLGFIVVEIVFGLYFTIELYCRPLGSNWPSEKERIIFQPSIFWVRTASFRECTTTI